MLPGSAHQGGRKHPPMFKLLYGTSRSRLVADWSQSGATVEPAGSADGRQPSSACLRCRLHPLLRPAFTRVTRRLASFNSSGPATDPAAGSRKDLTVQFTRWACYLVLGWLVSGCAALTGPHGFGQRVLLIWKVTPAQTEAAQTRVNQYFTAVAHHQKPRPKRRYVAVQTLDPNPKQQLKYLQSRAAAQAKAESEDKGLGPEWVEPSQLHCVMVFDLETHEFVGGVCYVVSSMPAEGEVNVFETYAAEFIASSGNTRPGGGGPAGAAATPSFPLPTPPAKPAP